jgi:hypothetical protein
MNRAINLRVVKKPIAPKTRKNAGMATPTMSSPWLGLLTASGNTSGPNIIGMKLATTPRNPPTDNDTNVPVRGVMFLSVPALTALSPA